MTPLDDLHSLISPFPTERSLFASVEHVSPATIPERYRTLLVHRQHMTVEMERHHGRPMTLEVLDRCLIGRIYTRQILLRRSDDRRPVQFSTVRFDLRRFSPDVRDEVLSETTPVGHILISHNVIRRIQLEAVLEIQAGPLLATLLEMPEAATTYGRLATIACDHLPAIDLLEITAPL